jgi:hypothetical protein
MKLTFTHITHVTATLKSEWGFTMQYVDAGAYDERN